MLDFKSEIPNNLHEFIDKNDVLKHFLLDDIQNIIHDRSPSPVLSDTMDKTQIDTDREEKLNEICMERAPRHCHRKLLPLLKKYSDIFALPSNKMTQNNFYEQKLRLKDDTPVHTKNYRLPRSQKAEIDSHVNKLLQNDLIEAPTSPYNSPLILVPKKSTEGAKKWRMCEVMRKRIKTRPIVATV